jgi:hypothetical protein
MGKFEKKSWDRHRKKGCKTSTPARVYFDASQKNSNLLEIKTIRSSYSENTFLTIATGLMETHIPSWVSSNSTIGLPFLSRIFTYSFADWLGSFTQQNIKLPDWSHLKKFPRRNWKKLIEKPEDILANQSITSKL